MSGQGERLLTKQEAAAAMSIGLSTLDRLIRQGRLRTVRIGLRGVRIPTRALDELIAELDCDDRTAGT